MGREAGDQWAYQQAKSDDDGGGVLPAATREQRVTPPRPILEMSHQQLNLDICLLGWLTLHVLWGCQFGCVGTFAAARAHRQLLWLRPAGLRHSQFSAVENRDLIDICISLNRSCALVFGQASRGTIAADLFAATRTYASGRREIGL